MVTMSCKGFRTGLLLGAVWLVMAPGEAWGCPVCFGAVDSPMTHGMNWAIFALLGVTGSVLFGFAAFFMYLFKRSRMTFGEEVEGRPSAQQEGVTR